MLKAMLVWTFVAVAAGIFVAVTNHPQAIADPTDTDATARDRDVSPATGEQGADEIDALAYPVSASGKSFSFGMSSAEAVSVRALALTAVTDLGHKRVAIAPVDLEKYVTDNGTQSYSVIIPDELDDLLDRAQIGFVRVDVFASTQEGGDERRDVLQFTVSLKALRGEESATDQEPLNVSSPGEPNEVEEEADPEGGK